MEIWFKDKLCLLRWSGGKHQSSVELFSREWKKQTRLEGTEIRYALSSTNLFLLLYLSALAHKNATQMSSKQFKEFYIMVVIKGLQWNLYICVSIWPFPFFSCYKNINQLNQLSSFKALISLKKKKRSLDIQLFVQGILNKGRRLFVCVCVVVLAAYWIPNTQGLFKDKDMFIRLN